MSYIEQTDYDARLVAELDGKPLFETTRAKLLHEGVHKPVPYIPLEDFDQSRLQRTDHSSHCPFKGDASYWSVGDHANVVWAYEQPKDGVQWLKGYAAVYFDKMDGWTSDGEPLTSASALPGRS